MKKVILYLLPLFVLSLSPVPVLAQKVGSTSMQFLKVMPCARATAMGEAYSVLATGAEAIFWNPAGMASLQNNPTHSSEASLTYVRWIFETQQGALAACEAREAPPAYDGVAAYVTRGRDGRLREVEIKRCDDERADLDAARRELERFEEEARRLGVPPGWLR